jgi:hypothetical protein
MKSRKIDLETKMAAVLEGLKGESSLAEICRNSGDQENSGWGARFEGADYPA